MQFPNDTDLANALAAPDVMLDIQVEFDWNRDDGYNHVLSDLSRLVGDDYSISSPNIAGNGPDELNVVTGYSSSECQLSLSGRLKYDDMPMHQVFSPYLKTSPLFGVSIKGTPMRVHRIVYDEDGNQLTPIRQFTGWVRSFNVDVKKQSVSIVGSDIVDVNRKEVTLHNIAPTSGSLIRHHNLGPKGENSLNGVMSTDWVIEETLRQAGRPTGPRSQTDEDNMRDVFYMSCNGSFLPSIGYFSGNLHPAGNDDVLFFPQRISSVYEGDVWQKGKYGLTFKPLDRVIPILSGGAPFYESNAESWCTSEGVYVTENDSNAITTYMTFSAWVYSDGQATDGDLKPLSRIILYLDDVDNSFSTGHIDLVFYSDGHLALGIYDDGGTNPREWDASGILSEGWHFWYVIITFTPDHVAADLYVDDALQVSNQITPGYNYSSVKIRTTRTNVVNLFLHNPIQHIHIRYGFVEPTYDPSFKEPPTRDGLPLAVNKGSSTELEWIPNTYQRNPWEILKEVSASEYGVVHTNEYGQIIYRSHRNIIDVTSERFNNAFVVNEDHTLNLIVDPSIDEEINAIQVSATQRKLEYTSANSEDRTAWSNDDPFEMYASRSSRLHSRYAVIDEVAWVRLFPQKQTDNSSPFGFSRTRAALVSDPNVEPDEGSWHWDLTIHDQVHRLEIFWSGFSEEVYVGCDHNDQEPALNVWGATYGQKVRDTFEYTNASSTDDRRLLTLPDSDWRQTEKSVEQIATDLLSVSALARPIIENVAIRTDPRLQLLDVIQFRANDTISGDLYAQVVAIKRGASKDSVSLRALGTADDNDALWNHESRGWGEGEWVD